MARTDDRRRRKRLGELLLEAGLITRDDLQTALDRQREFSGRVGSHLIRIGAVTESVLLEFLSRTTGYPAVDLANESVDKELRNLIPQEFAEEHLAVPVKRYADRQSQVLTVAMADPTDLELADRLQFSTGCRIEPAVATESAVHRFIRRLYELPAVRTTRRDDLLPHITGAREEDPVSAPSAPLPFLESSPTRKRRFAALAELLIEKGVITREELIAKMQKEQSRRKG